jgi:glutathione S-transferase
MIVLCGMSISNYYNKVKMVLLEKGVPFTEEPVKTGRRDEEVLGASPLGKIPYIRTDQGTLCESQAIVDWLEARFPEPTLVPKDPWEAAKMHELVTFVDLHLELVVRELYPKAFFGGTVSESNAARVKTLLEKNIAGFARLARFAPYIAGPTFTQADCTAWASLPLVGLATRIVYGEDMLLAAGVDWKGYAKLIGERPSAQKVAADRKVEQDRLTAAR